MKQMKQNIQMNKYTRRCDIFVSFRIAPKKEINIRPN